jgi:hypothetical protein
MCHGDGMTTDDAWVGAMDRVALLRDGIVILKADMARRWVGVAGAGETRVRELVARRLGGAVSVDVIGVLPRRLEPRRCVGHMEREPGRLQLRFVCSGDEHMDDILVAEDERTVVVFATVCTSVRGEPGPRCEGPFHVYLEHPLGDRAVIDGVTGEPVPFKNIWAELERRQP